MKVSVIVVSRGRPVLLRKLIKALRFQTHKSFEVILVTDDPKDADIAKDVKFIHHEAANISSARNVGMTVASGEIFAFLDDDAIPEPNWLEELIVAFSDPKVAAGGGFVKGRNGISNQWAGIEVDCFGRDYPIEITDPTVRGLKEERHLKVQGCNMAFRKSALQKSGGFDEGFSFYFEETDLTRRLAKARFKIAINPKAQVVHSDAESSYRSSRRIPKSLRQLGASWRLFMDKHALATKAEEIRFQLCLQQRERLLKLMKIGWIEPRDVTRMQEEFDRAIVGQFNRSKIKKLTFSASKNFKAFQTKNAPPKTMYGSIWQAKALKRKAKSIADSGVPTHLFIFSRTSLFHHRAFDQDGYWIQKGGLFGRAARSETLFKKYNFEKRLEKERHRIAIDTGFNWGAGG